MIATVISLVALCFSVSTWILVVSGRYREIVRQSEPAPTERHRPRPSDEDRESEQILWEEWAEKKARALAAMMVQDEKNRTN